MYHSQLASIHDREFGDYAIHVAQFLLRQFPEATGPVVDLGCGSGQLLQHMAEAGIKVGYGNDLSPAMIALAKEKNPYYQLVVSDLFDSEIPHAQIVVMAGEILSYASTVPNRTDEDIRQFFSRIYDRLTNDGLFFFDCLGEGSYNYTSIHSYADLTLEMVSEQIGDVVHRTIRILNSTNWKVESAREIHKLRVFQSNKLREGLEEMGFRVKMVTDKADLQILPGRTAFLCRKR